MAWALQFGSIFFRDALARSPNPSILDCRLLEGVAGTVRARPEAPDGGSKPIPEDLQARVGHHEAIVTGMRFA